MQEWLQETKNKMYIYKITQKEVADRIGVSQPILSYIFNGLRTDPERQRRIIDTVDEIISERAM